MVRLEITIKEINSLDFKEITAIGTEISLKEIGKHATKNERYRRIKRENRMFYNSRFIRHY